MLSKSSGWAPKSPITGIGPNVIMKNRRLVKRDAVVNFNAKEYNKTRKNESSMYLLEEIKSRINCFVRL